MQLQQHQYLQSLLSSFFSSNLDISSACRNILSSASSFLHGSRYLVSMWWLSTTVSPLVATIVSRLCWKFSTKVLATRLNSSVLFSDTSRTWLNFLYTCFSFSWCFFVNVKHDFHSLQRISNSLNRLANFNFTEFSESFWLSRVIHLY